MILWPGTASDYPYSIGINDGVLWYCVPASGPYKIYNNGSEKKCQWIQMDIYMFEAYEYLGLKCWFYM